MKTPWGRDGDRKDFESLSGGEKLGKNGGIRVREDNTNQNAGGKVFRAAGSSV